MVLSQPRVARVGKQQCIINRAMKRTKNSSSNVFIRSLLRVGGAPTKPPSAYSRPLPQSPRPSAHSCRGPEAKFELDRACIISTWMTGKAIEPACLSHCCFTKVGGGRGVPDTRRGKEYRHFAIRPVGPYPFAADSSKALHYEQQPSITRKGRTKHRYEQCSRAEHCESPSDTSLRLNIEKHCLPLSRSHQTDKLLST
jgi:hypothetical protein